MSARSKARKRALDVLYEADQRIRSSAGEEGDDGAPPVGDVRAVMIQVLADRIAHPGTQTSLPEYSVQIVEGVAEHVDRIDEALSTFSQGWTLARMPAVDRAVLRLASWEILYHEEVPDAVAIDEAVRLAKSLSTDESPAFVNGLLGRIAQMGSSLLD